MNPAVQKTLTLFLLIAIGFVLKAKIKSKEQLKGIKILILSIALPATIFIALLKVNIEPSLLFMPFMALLANLFLFLMASYFLPLFSGYQKASPAGRTLMMLVPSFAPGLSCFPFITEYFGEETLAFAALADVGNKVFVLILLYLLAMHWYYQRNTGKEAKNNSKVKDLLLTLVREPVNLVMVAALGLLMLGLNMEALPTFLQDTVSRLSLIMTPMVLMFIGLAVKIDFKQLSRILGILLLRSGVAFLISAIAILLMPPLALGATALLVMFPQSACSFWPFAHISAVTSLEQAEEKPVSDLTFDLDLALNILALSLPFSTLVVLAICSFPAYFAMPWLLLGLGLSLLLLGAFFRIKRVNKPYEPASSKPKLRVQEGRV